MATNQSEYALHLADTRPGHEQLVVVLPGDELPEWAKITNPYVLGDQEHTVHAGDGPPPQAGTGSGVKVWRAYAESQDVDPDGLDRDEIIAALEAAGVPVE